VTAAFIATTMPVDKDPRQGNQGTRTTGTE